MMIVKSYQYINHEREWEIVDVIENVSAFEESFSPTHARVVQGEDEGDRTIFLIPLGSYKFEIKEVINE